LPVQMRQKAVSAGGPRFAMLALPLLPRRIPQCRQALLYFIYIRYAVFLWIQNK